MNFRDFPKALLAASALAAAIAQPPAPPPLVAPGAPGGRATWTNGNKQGVGTAIAPVSKVWFTLGDGVLTEAYYPTVDRANLRSLELIISDGAGFFERESTNTDHRVEPIARDVLAFRQTNTSRSGRYTIVRETFTDPSHQSIVVRVRFRPNGLSSF